MKSEFLYRHSEGLASLGLLVYMLGMTLNVGFDYEVWRWVVASGAAILIVARFFTRADSDDLRMRRLVRIQLWGAIFMVAAAALLFLPWQGITLRDFIAFTLAGAAIQIFTSFAIPARRKKLLKNG